MLHGIPYTGRSGCLWRKQPGENHREHAVSLNPHHMCIKYVLIFIGAKHVSYTLTTWDYHPNTLSVSCVDWLALFLVEIKMTWAWHRSHCNTTVLAKIFGTETSQILASKSRTQKTSTKSRDFLLCSEKYAQETLFQTFTRISIFCLMYIYIYLLYLCFFPFKSPEWGCLQRPRLRTST